MKKKILAVLLAALTALTMAACGAEDTEDAADTTAKTTAAEKADKDDKDDTTTTTAATTTEATTTKSDAPEPDTAYWDLLMEEFDRTYDKSVRGFTYVNDDTVYFGAIGYYYLVLYNKASGGYKWTDSWYSVYDGKLYGGGPGWQSGSYSLAFWDFDGKLVSQSVQFDNYWNDYPTLFSDDGYVVLKIDSKYFALSPDLKKLTQLTVTVDAGHGNTETVEEFSDVYCLCGHKLYVSYRNQASGQTEYGAIDITTNECEPFDIETYSFLKNSWIQQVGKYAVTKNNGIYDIETAEKISSLDLGCVVGHSQFYSYKNDSGTTDVYKCVIPENYKDFTGKSEDYVKKYGEKVYTSELPLQSFTYNDGDGVKYVSDDYIIIQDNTGYYLIELSSGKETKIEYTDDKKFTIEGM